MHYIFEAFQRLKPVVLTGGDASLIVALKMDEEKGLLKVKEFSAARNRFVDAFAHRIWTREKKVDRTYI